MCRSFVRAQDNGLSPSEQCRGAAAPSHSTSQSCTPFLCRDFNCASSLSPYVHGLQFLVHPTVTNTPLPVPFHRKSRRPWSDPIQHRLKWCSEWNERGGAGGAWWCGGQVQTMVVREDFAHISSLRPETACCRPELAIPHTPGRGSATPPCLLGDV